MNVVLSRGEVAGVHSSRGVLRDSNRASETPQAAAQPPTGQPGRTNVHQCSSLDQALELLASPELQEQVSWLPDAPGPIKNHMLPLQDEATLLWQLDSIKQSTWCAPSQLSKHGG